MAGRKALNSPGLWHILHSPVSGQTQPELRAMFGEEPCPTFQFQGCLFYHRHHRYLAHNIHFETLHHTAVYCYLIMHSLLPAAMEDFGNEQCEDGGEASGRKNQPPQPYICKEKPAAQRATLLTPCYHTSYFHCSKHPCKKDPTELKNVHYDLYLTLAPNCLTHPFT